MATASPSSGQAGSRDKACFFSNKPYGCGACAGGCSVVGFGVGTAGDVDGEGVGATVSPEGPVLVVSPVRSVVVRGYIIAITAKATAAASTSGSQPPKDSFGRPLVTGAFGSRGSRGFSYVIGSSW